MAHSEPRVGEVIGRIKEIDKENRWNAALSILSVEEHICLSMNADSVYYRALGISGVLRHLAESRASGAPVAENDAQEILNAFEPVLFKSILGGDKDGWNVLLKDFADETARARMPALNRRAVLAWYDRMGIARTVAPSPERKEKQKVRAPQFGIVAHQVTEEVPAGKDEEIWAELPADPEPPTKTKRAKAEKVAAKKAAPAKTKTEKVAAKQVHAGGQSKVTQPVSPPTGECSGKVDFSIGASCGADLAAFKARLEGSRVA